MIRQAPFSLVSSFICFLSIWSVIGLAGFHTYLTTSDQTTNEDVSVHTDLSHTIPVEHLRFVRYRSKDRSPARAVRIPSIPTRTETFASTVSTSSADP